MTESAPSAFFQKHPSTRNDGLMRDCAKLSGLLNRLSTYVILSSQLPGNDKRQMQIKVVSASLLSAGITLTSIIALNRELSLQVRDALVLSRVFYETCLSGTFMSCDNGDRARRAESYAIIQAFKSQKKFKKIGKIGALFGCDRGLRRDHPRLKQALDEFRRPNGSLERNCFRESREEMITEIGLITPHASIMLSAIEAMIFEIGSELAHGSYFGFLESPYAGPKSGIAGLESSAELVGFTVIFSASCFAHGVSHLLKENQISNEIIEVGDRHLRELAAEHSIHYSGRGG